MTNSWEIAHKRWMARCFLALRILAKAISVSFISFGIPPSFVEDEIETTCLLVAFSRLSNFPLT